MIYTYTHLTLKILLKWILFLILIDIFFAFFFWSLSKELPLISRFLHGIISSGIILAFAALPLIFSKNVKPYLRLMMVSVCCAIGNAAGLTFVSIYFYKLPYDRFMFLYIMTLMILSIIIGFLYYWEGIAVTNSILQKERIKRLDNEKEIVQTRLRLVQTPIEPGFLFSTLKQVLSLLDIDVDKAKSLQMGLIQYLRLSLSKVKKESHSISQEMNLISAYLDIIKKHPDHSFDYNIDIPAHLYDHNIPSMLLYMVAEMMADYVKKSNRTKRKLSFRGEHNPSGIKFEMIASGLTHLNDAEILLAFQDIRERVNNTFGEKAFLLLKTNMPDSFTIIVKLAPTG